MVDWDLFVHLAEIAGVFVGFGALIAVRNDQASDAHTVEYLRAVVGGGVLVVITALAPLVVSRFDVAGRALWLPCSVFFLAVFLTFWIVDARSPENRIDRRENRALTVRYAAVALPLTFAMVGAEGEAASQGAASAAVAPPGVDARTRGQAPRVPPPSPAERIRPAHPPDSRRATSRRSRARRASRSRPSAES